MADWQQGQFVKRSGGRKVHQTTGDWLSHEVAPTNHQPPRLSQPELQPTSLSTPFGTSNAEELNFTRQQADGTAHMATMIRRSDRPQQTIHRPSREEKCFQSAGRRAAGGLAGYASSAALACSRVENVDLSGGEQRKALYGVGGKVAGTGGFYFPTS
eukprot:TRINITY_DN1710_c0_g1_i3.p1 TRINITY_DN1710_c0_g1~~TRINITY_DN1710_c0_g1_i3.p1  ORF type:complete len:157 (+),score=25.55 TRINITY_DN1710_c0_g1_i3:223-693(+)